MMGMWAFLVCQDFPRQRWVDISVQSSSNWLEQTWPTVGRVQAWMNLQFSRDQGLNEYLKCEVLNPGFLLPSQGHNTLKS